MSETEISKDLRKNRSFVARHKVGLILGIVLVILIVLVVAHLVANSPVRQNDETQASYSVEEVSSGTISKTVSGSGTLEAITQETFTASSDGEVKKVKFSAGDTVEEDDVIAVITDDDGDKETIQASFDGVITELSISKGDTVTKGAQIAQVMGTDGFTMDISVDESDIDLVEKDQDVDFSIEASSESYTGKVASISYNGTASNGTTTFPVSATIDYEEGLYPGMTATAQIVIEESEEGLIVPVAAVKTSGDEKYVYLAPDGSSAGESLESDAVDLSSLEKVYVDTDMSDDSYISVTGEGLVAGALIIVATESTEEESDSKGGFDGEDGMGFDKSARGDMMDGEMPSGGAMGAGGSSDGGTPPQGSGNSGDTARGASQ